MKQKDFEELLMSVKAGGRILQGKQKPARVFDYREYLNGNRKRTRPTPR
jgi:hypothetical protein